MPEGLYIMPIFSNYLWYPNMHIKTYNLTFHRVFSCNNLLKYKKETTKNQRIGNFVPEGKRPNFGVKIGVPDKSEQLFLKF